MYELLLIFASRSMRMTIAIAMKQIPAIISIVTMATAAWYHCHHSTKVPTHGSSTKTKCIKNESSNLLDNFKITDR